MANASRCMEQCVNGVSDGWDSRQRARSLRTGGATATADSTRRGRAGGDAHRRARGPHRGRRRSHRGGLGELPRLGRLRCNGSVRSDHRSAGRAMGPLRLRARADHGHFRRFYRRLGGRIEAGRPFDAGHPCRHLLSPSSSCSRPGSRCFGASSHRSSPAR